MKFKFELNQFVEISISGEMGHIKGRAEYTSHVNGYQVHYKAADGRAVESWFDEDDIKAVEASNPVRECSIHSDPANFRIKF